MNERLGTLLHNNNNEWKLQVFSAADGSQKLTLQLNRITMYS